MNTKEFTTMVSLFQHLGVQVLLLKNEEDKISRIDYGFRGRMLKNFNYTVIFHSMEHYLEEGTFYFYEDDLKLHYCLYRFFPEDAKTANGQIFSIGPVLFQPISQKIAQELIEKLEIPPRYHQDFMEFFNRIPFIPSFDLWNHLLGFFFPRCELPMKFRQANQNTLRWYNSSDYDYSIPDMPDVALKTIEERYQWENAMLAAVRSGNTREALNAHYQFLQYKLLPRVSDPVRNSKNLLFTLNTLLRKSAEMAQVHPLHIDNLSRQFAIQIEASFTLPQVQSLSTSMIRKYCMLVNNYSRRSYSSLVQTCMDYVDFHYNEDLSLASLASLCCVSSSYLSALFKKETSMTITDYINSTRIRQSLTFLNATNLSIGEIASRCGFADANYFTRTFKKIQGMTPKAYRDEIHHT